MKRLSKTAEQKLLDAVDVVTDLLLEGGNPNDAIVKVANEHQLPSNHIPLLVHATNIAQTNAQRRGAESVFDKGASFPIADTQKVMKSLYPDYTKQAEDQEVAPEWSRPPTDWLNAKAPKEAALQITDWSMGPKSQPYEPYEDRAFKKAEADKRNIIRHLEESRLQTANAFDTVLSTTATLHQYFKEAGHLPFCDVRDQAVLMFGNKAEQLFNFLSEDEPRLTKQASVGFIGPVNCRPFDLIAQCISTGKDFTTKEAIYKLANEKYDTIKLKLPEPIKIPLHVLEKWSKDEEANTPGKKSKCEDDGILSKSALAGLGNMALGSAASSLLAGPTQSQTSSPVMTSGGPASPTPESLAYELSSPDHENDLRSIQTSAWLQNLMVSDPIIGAHPHESVANAYNQLAKLAPRTMGNPLVAKTLLSKYLSQDGRVELFDASGGLAQILDIENKMKDRDSYPAHVDPFAGPTMPDSSEYH